MRPWSDRRAAWYPPGMAKRAYKRDGKGRFAGSVGRSGSAKRGTGKSRTSTVRRGQQAMMRKMPSANGRASGGRVAGRLALRTSISRRKRNR